MHALFALVLALAPQSIDDAPVLRLASPCSSGMVVQRDARAAIWGRARPGAAVEVRASWAGDAFATANADEHGEWRVELATPGAGGPHSIRVSSGEEVVLDDVWSGEVWLCAGQSNMEWAVEPGPLGGVHFWVEETRAATRPRIRHFDAPNRLAIDEARDAGGAWVACSPETVGSFSAVAYFFARELERELDAPIGIVNATWSGTPIQAWMDELSAAKFEASARGLEAVARARKAGEASPKLRASNSTVLFNGMIAPLTPMTLRGFLWYQGESDREIAAQYEGMQRALIESWRARFRAPNAPFYFVQIAPFAYRDDHGETGALRDAQRRVLSLADTGMAVTMDIGDPEDIHPRNKQDVGKRLARLALAWTYGRDDVIPCGPLVKAVEREGEKLRVRFEHVGGGLVSAADHLEGFELVDLDGGVRRARAEIDGDSVLVWHPDAPAPAQVRYGYGAAMQPVLFNKEWLPAAAFCVDVEAPR